MRQGALVVLWAGIVGVNAAQARQPVFRGLGTLSGFDRSWANAVSVDGRVVVGYCLQDRPGGVREAFQWTLGSGMRGLGDLPGGGEGSNATTVSGDGSVVYGMSGTPRGQRAFRWTAQHGIAPFGDQWAFQVTPIDCSTDGQWVVGSRFLHLKSPAYSEAVIADASGVWMPLGTLPGGEGRESRGSAISADGRVVVGHSAHGPLAVAPFRWTRSGMESLGLLDPHALPEPYGYATDCSADGNMVVGVGRGVEDEAWVWTRPTGLVSIHDPVWRETKAIACSADASVIVGWAWEQNGRRPLLVWRRGLGWRGLIDVLADLGVKNTVGWQLDYEHGHAVDVSADGSVLVGYSINQCGEEEAWRIDLRGDPIKCAADCEQCSGPQVLDIFDFLCFQNRFAASDRYACDFDESTGPAVCDIFDFLAFQNAFAAGCP